VKEDSAYEAPGLDLDALVRNAARGFREAWDLLVDEYAWSVFAVTRKWELETSEAQKAAEAAWLSALDHIGECEDASQFETILSLAAWDACRNIRARRVAIASQRLTTLAVFLVGKKRSAVSVEWRTHLAGWTGRGLGRRDQVSAARGFLWGAVKIRLQDAADQAWRPVDAVLGSRTLSNLFVLGPVIVTLAAIVHHDGRFGLVADIQDPIALGIFLYGAIKAGRRWRGVKPLEPKARRVKE
jgi:hypothetical protein